MENGKVKKPWKAPKLKKILLPEELRGKGLSVDQIVEAVKPLLRNSLDSGAE